jgi:predicted nucleotidyltransferase
MVQKRDNLELEIVLVLLRGENHLRGIAKQLNESHSTILRKLNKLMIENVLGYRIEGKNKVFFFKKNLQAKNYVFNAERHKLIELLKKYPELDAIMEDISKAGKEPLIIIFGSYAKFVAKKNSDIDLFVETRNSAVKEHLESIHSRIKVKLGDFDLSSSLIKEIIKNHVILRGVEEFYEKTKFFE